MKHIVSSLLFLLCAVTPLIAGEVDVTDVKVYQEGENNNSTLSCRYGHAEKGLKYVSPV